ncbi:hypothetical protein AN0663.2 [Aspergillus nidulans FGSC A4]|nr:hypothetical protein AN0663.2 [Aspergillus nidulans FGSC A4]|eukprot:XP_658267.1 hypothetical protein AN0663.2 [Aspergillus nidulans FGSC A4]
MTATQQQKSQQQKSQQKLSEAWEAEAVNKQADSVKVAGIAGAVKWIMVTQLTLSQGFKPWLKQSIEW